MTAAPSPGAAPVASIDDLLGHDDDDLVLQEARQPSAARWWVRNTVLVAVAAAATVAVLRTVGVRVDPLIVLAAFAALRLLYRIVGDVAPPPLPRPGVRPRPADEGTWHWQGTDGLRSCVHRWEQQLELIQSDAGRFSRNVLPVLAELTDERLRLRHGVTRASDPQRARHLLGDDLWRLLDEPDRRPPKARDMAAYVEALEKL